MVCDTITFFVIGQAIVWYSKEHGEMECFNKVGYDPVKGDELRQRTEYVIREQE